jgi:pilus assembly protein CpaE
MFMAKGGIGTSSLCANLAMNIGVQHLESAVALADLVLPIGSIASIVGSEEPENLVTIGQRVREDPQAHLELVDLPIWHFHLLAGSPDPESASQLAVEAVPAVLEQVKRTHDYIVLDIGRSLSRLTLPIIQKADLVVLVVSPDLSSITLTRRVLAYLQAQGVQPRSIYSILNRAIGLEGLSRPEAEKALGLPIQSGIPYLPYFSLANNLHQPFALKFPNDTAAVVFKDIAGQITEMARHLHAAREPQ